MDKRREDDQKRGAIPKKSLKEKRSAKESIKSVASTKSEAARRGEPVGDPYKRTYDFKNRFRKPTAYGYVPSKEHESQWDKDHPECPKRAEIIHEVLENNILSRMQTIQPDELVTEDDALLFGYAHSPDYIRTVRSLCINTNPEEAQMYDNIFYNTETSMWCAARAVKMAVSMAKLVAEGKYQNGFANIRPPGHHATAKEPNGYCLFNNVAITANYLLEHKLAEKILIVDYDVHHGHGTQQMFYDSNKVLYFSIHRYERGTFWPKLQESNYDFIGQGDGIGHNINVPLNETGMDDYDYLAIIINVLLPVAYEFEPSIVLVSGGYDACLGDPEGQMNLTPAFYGHVITLLSGLAQGKLVVLLEGGYFLPGLAESALRTVRALLNDPCNKLEYSRHINPSVKDAIHDVKVALRPHWRCFYQFDHLITVGDFSKFDKYGLNLSVEKYIGVPKKPPFPITGGYSFNTTKQEAMFVAQLAFIKEDRYNMSQTKIGYIFNHESINHNPTPEHRTQEVHTRIVDILTKLEEFGLTEEMIQIDFEHTKDDPHHPTIWDLVWEQIITTHSASYVYEVGATLEEPRADLYWSDKSRDTCQWSVAILCQLAKKIKRGFIRHGVGIIRPPGYHAKYAEGGGFCLINNVVCTANYLIRKEGYGKILIVDFDVHHGDGTQELTYGRRDIMYISMHRYDHGKFYPRDQIGNFTYVGEGRGIGYNLNIPFNDGKMDNADYLQTFIKIVLPVSYAYNPDMILVSAGFDAAVNDPLGNYNVFPEVYGHFIQLLKPIAPVIIALEGGYHLESTSLGMVNVVKALLGHPLPAPYIGDGKDSTLKTIMNVITVAKPHWPIMECNKWVDTQGSRKHNDDEGLKSVKVLNLRKP